MKEEIKIFSLNFVIALSTMEKTVGIYFETLTQPKAIVLFIILEL